MFKLKGLLLMFSKSIFNQSPILEIKTFMIFGEYPNAFLLILLTLEGIWIFLILSIYNRLLINILQVISQKYGRNL